MTAAAAAGSIATGRTRTVGRFDRNEVQTTFWLRALSLNSAAAAAPLRSLLFVAGWRRPFPGSLPELVTILQRASERAREGGREGTGERKKTHSLPD